MAITTDETDDTKYEDSFKTAFRAGSVMGFLLTSIGILFLYCLILIYQKAMGATNQQD
jgi:Na+/H+-translocating membrane pyrophosphatase